MKILKSLLLCGCPDTEASRCVYKGWTGASCHCPCHYSNEQTMKLLSAYLSVEQLANFARKRITAPVKAAPAFAVIHQCGHEKHFDRQVSKMAIQYIQQNDCDDCREKNGAHANAH